MVVFLAAVSETSSKDFFPPIYGVIRRFFFFFLDHVSKILKLVEVGEKKVDVDLKGLDLVSNQRLSL